MKTSSFTFSALLFILSLLYFFSCSDDYLPDLKGDSESVIFSKDEFLVSGSGSVSMNFADTIIYSASNDSLKVSFDLSTNIDTSISNIFGSSILVRGESTSYFLRTFIVISDFNSSYEFYFRVGTTPIVSLHLSAAFVCPVNAFIKFGNIKVVRFN